MAEDLQGLLNRIQSQGVKKAEDEKASILATAKDEAAKIIAAATEKAETLVKKAEKDASASEARAKAAIQQASRDVVLALKAELSTRLKSVVKDCLGQALNADTLSKIIIEMVKAGAQGKTGVGVELLLAKKDSEELEKMVKGGLLANLQAKPVISIGRDFSSGLKIGFTGSDVYFDLSDEALSSIICEFVGPKLAALIDPSAKA
jgi:V/A-type H+/Na+-transporting ATPase subunit E